MFRTYTQALDYIYSFIDYSLTRNLRYSADKFNLDRMARFLELLDNPQYQYKVIHVAGTKGKGSTAAMLASILEKNGYKTGFYSSPHMIDFLERIRIGNRLISQQSIIQYINTLEPVISKVPELTSFEIITGMSFQYFADQNVEFAVIEVGMGGRFDATNVVKPEVSVITTISHDHTKILGNTLGKIAFEKAGIIKSGVPVILSRQKQSALIVFREEAAAKSAELIYTPDLYSYKSVSYSLEGQDFEVNSNQGKYLKIHIPLLGDHQIENAMAALACIREIEKKDTRIREELILSGFKNLNWPGRFEIVNNTPLVIIDGAHNKDSFRKLRRAITKYLPGKKIILVFGASEDKEVAAMLKIIKPTVKIIIITKTLHPRAFDTAEIEKLSITLKMPYRINENIKSALGEAFAQSDDSTAIIAAGSLFVAGAVREILKGKR